MNDTQPKQHAYRCGDRVPATGVYEAIHSGHRNNHEVTLLAQEIFPRCAQCGSDVQFVLLFVAPQVEKDADFRSRRLFEIPHPDRPKPEEAA